MGKWVHNAIYESISLLLLALIQTDKILINCYVMANLNQIIIKS